MRTTVSKRYQTVVPAALRERYQIKKGDHLEWIDDGMVIKLIPIPADPITTLRGSARGEQLVEKLLQARREDKSLE